MATIGIKVNSDGTTQDVTDQADPLETVFHTAVDVGEAWRKPASYPVESAIPLPGDLVLFACLVAECGPENPYGSAVAETLGAPGLVCHGPVFVVQQSIDSDDPMAWFGPLADDVATIVRDVVGRQVSHA
jgi:hypothetical protein